MKLSTKAALFSVFIFPGSGYFLVNSKPRGFACVALFLSAIGVLMVEAFHKAEIIAMKIVQGQIPNNIQFIREQILLTPGKFEPAFISSLSWFLLAVWLLSAIDSYRLGRAMAHKQVS